MFQTTVVVKVPREASRPSRPSPPRLPRSVSQGLAARWGDSGLEHGVRPNPRYVHNEHCGKRLLTQLLGALFVAGMIVVVLLACMLVMELEVLIKTTPLCGSWIYDAVWRDYVAGDGQHRNDGQSAMKISLSRVATGVLPGCFTTWSTDPFGWVFGLFDGDVPL